MRFFLQKQLYISLSMLLSAWNGLGSVPYFKFIILAISFILFAITIVEPFFSESNLKKKRLHCLKNFHHRVFDRKPDLDSMNRITYFTEKSIYLLKIKFTKEAPWVIFQVGWGKYLLIDSRTGRYSNSNIKWPINKNKKKKNRGIAGISWYMHKIVKIEDLPDVQSQDVDQKNYASQCYMAIKDIDKLNVKSKSYMGIPIENEEGCRSGVIVIDSIHEKIPKTITKGEIDTLAKVMMYIG